MSFIGGLSNTGFRIAELGSRGNITQGSPRRIWKQTLEIEGRSPSGADQKAAFPHDLFFAAFVFKPYIEAEADDINVG